MADTTEACGGSHAEGCDIECDGSCKQAAEASTAELRAWLEGKLLIGLRNARAFNAPIPPETINAATALLALAIVAPNVPSVRQSHSLRIDPALMPQMPR